LRNFRNFLNRLLEIKLNKTIIVFCVAGLTSPVFAAAPGDLASHCAIGSVKLQWKPVKRCIVFDSEAKLKATLDTWGWGEQPLPAINWGKDVAVVDSGNNPYGNGVASCGGVFADADKKNLTMRWGWKQDIVPSSASRAKADASDPNAKDKPIMDKAKESVGAVVTDAKQTMKDIVDDAKKFPSPIPKRAALIAVIPKELLANKAKVECVVEK
jgi:hypothetical protein